MRHLFETGSDSTLCAIYFRDRPSVRAVHVSHARKTDCPGCRRSYRVALKAARTGMSWEEARGWKVKP